MKIDYGPVSKIILVFSGVIVILEILSSFVLYYQMKTRITCSLYTWYII